MKGQILVTGSEGLVGSRFVEISEHKNYLHPPKEVELDITDPAELKALISSYNFNAVVHFAAYTNVDEAEKQRGDKQGDCWVVNVEGTKNLVEAIKLLKTKVHFIHISTDMVFPGTRDDPGPYLENHPLDHDLSQLTWYGYTKAQAERIVQETLAEQATIVRLIYPVRASFEGNLDFLRRAIKLFDQGRLYPVFVDQQISITFIDEACKLLDRIISGNHRGVFHASSRDITTPFEIISYCLEKTRGVKDVVEPINLDEFLIKTNTPSYRYPKYGGLSTSITEHKLGVTFSCWREIVDKLVIQGLGQ